MRKAIAGIGVYWRLIRGHKPIGTVLLLWPAMWAVWLATEGEPLWTDVLIILACAFLTRSAGCAINDWADRDIDGRVARTRTRPLAAGELAPRKALVAAGVLLAIAFALSWWLSHLVYWMLPVALGLIVLYPFTKRFFAIPQLVLALAFAMAAPISWYAVAGELRPECLLLLIVCMLWVFTYDTIYALSDIKDDEMIGVHSSARFFGDNARAAIILLHALLLAGLWVLGQVFELTSWWRAGLALALVSVIYQHYLIARGREGDYLRAFVHNGWFGLIIWLGLFLNWQ